MSTLTTTRNYADTVDLTEAQLDAALDSVETWANGNIGATNIGTGGVEAANIASGAVTASKIDTDAVTTAKILDANVTTAKIADLNVTTGKLAAASVTQAKRAALGQQVSSASGDYTTTSSSFTAVTNLTVTITTTGRPIFLGLISDVNSASSWVNATTTNSTVAFFEDSTQVTQQLAAASSSMPPGAYWHVYVPAAATYTFTCKVKNAAGNQTNVRHCKLIAYEL